MDRCALFVDASYVLADGALAVHGTRNRDSVSWEYAGFLKLLGGLSRDRTGLPLLRCYWYEATADGRRTAEHELLADLPGVKLRVAKLRPSRREGVEAEIRRDLTALARSHAISDAVVVSAEEDLAPVIAEVQDLGLRVTIVHIAADSDLVARALRQESDDVVEISAAHLRPYVDLIAGAEPAQTGLPTAGYRELTSGRPPLVGPSALAPAAQPSLVPAAPQQHYQAPAPADPQPVGQPALAASLSGLDQGMAQSQPGGFHATDLHGPDLGRSAMPPALPDAQPATGRSHDLDRPDRFSGQYQPHLASQPPAADHAGTTVGYGQNGFAPQPPAPGPGIGHDLEPGGPGLPVRGQLPGSGLPPARLSGSLPPAAAAPHGLPGQGGQPQPPQNGYQPLPGQLGGGSGQHGGMSTNGMPQSAQPPPRQQQSDPGQAGYGSNGLLPSAHAGLSQTRPAGPGGYLAGDQGRFSQTHPSMPPQPTASQRHDQAGFGQNGTADGQRPPAQARPPAGGLYQQPAPHQQPVPPGQYTAASAQSGQFGPSALSQPALPQPGLSQPALPQPPLSQPGLSQPALPQPPMPQPPAQLPVPQPPVPQPVAMSLADAAQAAHAEGFGFGEAVARDAPALWLEAVLARKPRMPSDLEARLLQGSALPIDSLLHDEVRHALRRGFWDALERSRH